MQASPIEFKTWDSLSEDEVLERDMNLYKAANNYQMMTLQSEGAQLVAERFNLTPFWTYYLEFNAANMLPYHNVYHATCMFLNAYEAAWHHRLEDEETRGLLVAALMHDFNHTGGEFGDEDNIKLALRGLNMAQHYAISLMLGLNAVELKTAQDCIKVTQFPYVINPTTIPEMIMMDADLMQPYEDDVQLLVEQYVGLHRELNINRVVTEQPLITKPMFVNGIDKFLGQVSWHTRWASEKAHVKGWDAYRTRLVAQIRKYYEG